MNVSKPLCKLYSTEYTYRQMDNGYEGNERLFHILSFCTLQLFTMNLFIQ